MQTSELYFGIDVSKQTLDIDSVPQSHRTQFSNDAAGHQSLAALLVKLQPQWIVVEATGGYETEVVSVLATAGLRVAVINPRQARQFAGATGVYAKQTRSMPVCWPVLVKRSNRLCVPSKTANYVNSRKF